MGQTDDGQAENGVPPSARDGLILGAHWGFLAFFIGLGGYHLMVLVLELIVPGGFDGLDPAELPEVGPVILLVFLPNLLLGLGPAIGARVWGGGLRAELRLWPDLRDLKVGLACGGFALLIGYLLNLALLAVHGTDRGADSPLTDIAGGLGDDVLWLVVTTLVIVLAAPMTEELLVRGALWGALDRHRVPPWVILVLTAIVFAYLHGEPTRTVALFGQGLAIGAARMITGRVGASFVAHAANNLPPALLLFATT